MLNELLKRLTDNYNKDPASNVGKLLGIIAGELSEIKQVLFSTEEYRDIDKATGVTLDNIGKNVQQYRGAANDGIYRILIKSKIARNQSKGDVNTIIRVLAITLNTQPEEISIDELWDVNEPAAIHVSVPTESLNAVGFSITQFGRLVNRIVAAGVRANVLFQGTFTWSSQENISEFDVNTGLADDDQINGGTLGSIYDPANDINLPL